MIKNKIIFNVSICFFLYLLLLVYYGYTFGDNDQIELMSYVKYLNNSALYPNDFYIQHIAARVPNERFGLAYLLSWSGKYLDIFSFILHLVSNVFLLWGLHKIAKIWIKNELLIVLGYFIFFFVLYQFNLGGNDIYYNALNVAKALSIWVLYFSLQRKFYTASVLAICTTLAHPMVGVQIFTLSFGAYFFYFLKNFIQKKILSEEYIILKRYFIAAFIFALLAGTWLGLMLLDFNEGKLPPSLLAEIINFRLPHHFVPSYFGLKNYLVLIPLIGFAWYFWYKNNTMLFNLFGISICGLIIYSIFILFFNNYSIIATQWFKTTVWLKPLALIAVLKQLENTIPKRYFSLNQLQKTALFLLPAMALIVLSLRKQNDYHFPNINYQSAIIDISLKAKENTPQNATFITPASVTAFKFYSERSNYIDFKAVTHNKTAFAEWYDRIDEIYQLKSQTIKGLGLAKIADEHFNSLNESQLIALKQKGITHILRDKTHPLQLKIVVANEQYIIYEL